MNAKALLALIDECGMIELVNRSGRDSDGWIQETILRALRLLAAAGANDGNCPETEAAMCRYTGGEPVTFPKGLSAVVPYSFAANLERERNGLAARVRELERVESYAVNLTCEVVRAISDDNLCGREIDEILSNALAEQPAGFTAARSKP